MAGRLQGQTHEPYGSWRIFVKRIQSLSFLATLAIAIGMISWGSALHAQSTSTPSDQQMPSTQQPPAPEAPPASQQTPTAQSPSQTPSTPPSSTPDQSSPSAQPPASSQAPSSQSPSSTPDATSPDAGAKSGSSASPSAGTSTDASGSQTFSGTVVKQGDKYVLKDDSGKVYDIDHQSDVAKFEGKRVRVQGTLDPSGKIMVK